jgi:integration host factor subunit alpha
MFRPLKNVTHNPETSLLKRRFSCFCAYFTSEPTASNTATEELSLNKRDLKEIVELHYEDVLAILNDDDQVKLPGFSNFDLLDSSQRSGSNPKTGEPLATGRCEVTFRLGQ